MLCDFCTSCSRNFFDRCLVIVLTYMAWTASNDGENRGCRQCFYASIIWGLKSFIIVPLLFLTFCLCNFLYN